MMKSLRSLSVALGLLALLSVAAAYADTVQLKMRSTGAAPDLGAIRPQRQNLVLLRPAEVKKLPADATAPVYVVLHLGPKEHPTDIPVLLDEPDGKPSRLFVDANANGDLTDDPLPAWTRSAYKSRDGKDRTLYSGDATVQVLYGKATLPLHLKFWRYDRDDPDRPLDQGALLYQADYAPEGEITLGGAKYKALLADILSTGDFRGGDTTGASGVFLFIDVNGNGVFDTRGEIFDVRQPFNIKGTTYEIKNLDPSGASFEIVKSDKTVPEIPPPPDLRVGKPVPAFEAKATDGKKIAFPANYRGKLVLLYFWATWCPECGKEVPFVTKAYETFHAQGLEILGVSLDHANSAAQLAAFTRQNHMPWPEIYDGKFFQAEIAMLYGVMHTPTPILVDGDTGIILATGTDLRGDRLSETLQDALKKHAASASAR